MNTKTLIEKIKNEKQLRKMTNAELSEKSGVKLGTLNKILSFKTESIKIDTLNKLLKVFDNANLSSEMPLSKATDYGFIKVAVSNAEVKVANVDYNTTKIIEEIEKANSKGVNLLVFPNLSITSASCGDLFYQDTLLSSAKKGLLKIVNSTINKNILVFVSLPLKINGALYDVAVSILNGNILGFTPKTNFTFKDDFDFKYFNTVPNFDEITFENKVYPFSNKLVYVNSQNNNFSVSVELDNELFTNMQNLTGANVIVNLSSDNEIVGKKEFRRNVIKSKTAINNVAYLYANSGFGESSSDLVYSGDLIVAENGKILIENELFKTDTLVTDIDVDYLAFIKSKTLNNVNNGSKVIYFNQSNDNYKLDRKFSTTPFVPTESQELSARLELILKMQSTALRKRISHVNPKTLVLGVSGGLDSTLALLVCVRAMKEENRSLKDVIAVTMPCFGTTSRTKNNATTLSEVLGVTLKTINISKAVSVHFEDIGQDMNVHDVTFENAQARERTQVLMDIANKTGGLVIGTGDLSELALGWATYNGDHMSNYAINSSIPKTLLRHLVMYEALNSSGVLKTILFDILDTPVSPELIPPNNEEIAQKTEDIVGPYILHDFYLYYALRKGYSPSKIYFISKQVFKNSFNEDTLYKWLRNFYYRFFAQQFKRSCMPDGVKIGTVGFSPRGDLKMPSDACVKVWLDEIENLKK